jgi:hypothetical protein
MNPFQRMINALRSLFTHSSLGVEAPLPLFPDRTLETESVATGTTSPSIMSGIAQFRLVEFIGGPLDGYRENLRPEDLAETFAIPVTAFALAALAGSKVVGQRRDPTSVAVYELDSTLDSPVRYFFLGAAAPDQIYRDIDTPHGN